MTITNSNFIFPTSDFEDLIADLGWQSIMDWEEIWTNNAFYNFKRSLSSKYKDDWICGLLLPLISNALQFKSNSKDRKIIGLSALPGTGKTSLGELIMKMSSIVQINIKVISIDDFYMPSDERIEVMKENPWNVSRGFPGTHSTDLMLEKLIKWKENGVLNVPVFDKSLKNGLGDRSHWITESPDLLILEGWFLGVKPVSDIKYQSDMFSCLSSYEISYCSKIQQNLYSYLEVWKLIDKLWHLKPKQFNYMYDWKTQQEKEMLEVKGSALNDQRLSEFLRMLYTSLPHKSFDDIDSDYLVLLNKSRGITWSGLTKNYF